jgi:hypothetical protein
VAVGVVAVLVVGLRAWMIRREARRLALEIAVCRAEGMDIGGEPEPPVEDDQNAAVGVSRAAARLADQWRRLTSKQVEDGVLDARAWEDADIAMGELGDALARAGVRWEPVGPKETRTEIRRDPRKACWSDLRMLRQALRLAADRAMKGGDERGFLEAVALLRGLATAEAQETSLLGDLASLTTDGVGVELVLEFGGRMTFGGADGVKARQRARWLIDEWTQVSNRRSRPEVWISGMARQWLQTAGAALPREDWKYVGSDVLRGDATMLDDLSWWLLEAQRLRRATEGLEQARAEIAAVRAYDWPTAQTLLAGGRQGRGRETGAEPVDSVMIWTMPVFPDAQKWIPSRFRAMAEARLAGVALACRLYELDHDGAVPGRLEDLVPAYLAAVPADPYAVGGARLRYVCGTLPVAAKACVYSVGGGGPAASFRRQRPKWWNQANQAEWDRMNLVCFIGAHEGATTQGSLKR